MAYLPPSEKEKEDQLAAQGGESGAEKVVATEASSSSSQPAAQANQSAAKPNAPTSSGSYTNLMSYVDANKGKDSQMGQQVRGVVDTTANKATTGLQGYQGNAQTAINQGTVKKDDSLITGLATNPTAVDKDQFTQHYNATYGGPTAASEIEGFAPTQQGFEQVGRQVQSAGSGLEGRSILLNDAYGRPTYTSGEKRLDSFILGTGKGGQEQLQGIQDTYNQFGGQFTDAVAGVEGQITQGKTETDATREATRTAYNNAVGGLEKAFDSAGTQATAWNAANKGTFDQTVSQMTSADPKVRAAAFQAAGIDPAIGHDLLSRGMTPQQILSYSGNKALGNFVDEGQVNNYNSLLGLLDGTNSKYNFDANVVGDSPFVVNQPLLQQGQQALDLEARTNAEVERRNAERQQQITDLQAALYGGFAGGATDDYNTLKDRLGMRDEDYYYDLNFAADEGLNLSDYITFNDEGYTAGNVMSEAEKQQYAEIIKLLGIEPTLNTRAVDGSRPYTFDHERFNTDYKGLTA